MRHWKLLALAVINLTLIMYSQSTLGRHVICDGEFLLEPKVKLTRLPLITISLVAHVTIVALSLLTVRTHSEQNSVMCCCLAAHTVMAACLPDYGYAISHTELQLGAEEVSLFCACYFFLHKRAWINTVMFHWS